MNIADLLQRWPADKLSPRCACSQLDTESHEKRRKPVDNKTEIINAIIFIISTIIITITIPIVVVIIIITITTIPIVVVVAAAAVVVVVEVVVVVVAVAIAVVVV